MKVEPNSTSELSKSYGPVVKLKTLQSCILRANLTNLLEDYSISDHLGLISYITSWSPIMNLSLAAKLNLTPDS